MQLGAAAKTFLLSLLAFFLFPVDRYQNQTIGLYCGVYALADDQAPPLTMGFMSLRAEDAERERQNTDNDPLTIFMKQQAPQVRQLHEPNALWIALNIRECNLLRGDRLVIRGNQASNRTILITAKNASLATTAWKNVAFWNNPFLVKGNTVTVEYIPSLSTLILPLPKQARDRPVVAIDSYTFAFPTPGSLLWSSDSGSRDESEASSGVSSAADAPTTTNESIVGSSSEMKEAVCFKKKAPKMYEKAKAVARLLITRQKQDPMTKFHSSTSNEITFPIRYPPVPRRRNAEYFCTGWLVGRGNHLLTNYHCLANLPTGGLVVNQQQQPNANGQEELSVSDLRHWLRGTSCSGSSASSASASSLAASAPGSSPSDGSLDGQAEAMTVNFMAETKTCREAGTQGERAGVIEATGATVVATSSVLDYALLRIEPNDSSTDLARKYGYLTLRASGPVDGEAIYIPQHPNGEPKEIATTKKGRPAVIRVIPGVHTSFGSGLSSFYLSGSSSSLDNTTASMNNPVNPNVFYNADTLPGSSGSPVLSHKDNTVVALHHAGGSAPISHLSGDYATGDSGSASGSSGINLNDYNSGIRTDLIVDDLRKQNALPACAVAPQSCGKQSKDPCCKAKW